MSFSPVTTKKIGPQRANRLLEIASILDLPTGRVFEPLVQALTTDNSAMVRAAAADALSQLGDVRAVGPLIDRLAKDEQPSVREAAANALSKFEGPEVLGLAGTGIDP